MWKFFLSILVGFTSLSLTNSIALSQSISCINLAGSNPETDGRDISVSRRVERSIWSLKAYPNFYNLFTCKIANKNLTTLEGIYTIPDDSTLLQAQVSFYLDGQLAQTLQVSRGEITPFSLNLRNHKSYAVEYTFVRGSSYDYLSALKWEFK